MAATEEWNTRIFPGRQLDYLVLGMPVPGVDVRGHNRFVTEETKAFPNVSRLRLVTPECRLADIEFDIKEYGFKGVYIHSFGYGLRVDDRKYYPLYETCVRMDVPVSMQMGHSAEAMESEVGRPMAMDKIALDFPRLTLIGSHTGWPWSQELIAMASKHRNVYMDISAWTPSFWDPWLVKEVDGRCRYKVMWGSNMMFARAGETFDEMDNLLTKEESKRAILRENAVRVYKL